MLRRLDRPEIDTIITDHGIQRKEFRQAVITLAGGNPLLAHTACQVALSKGKFDWSDASDLLRDLVAERLRALDDPDLHRTVAVGLALLTEAGDLAGYGDQDIAVLHGAVSGLPSEPDRLDRILDNLADAGLVDKPPYTFRPDLAAPVVLADAPSLLGPWSGWTPTQPCAPSGHPLVSHPRAHLAGARGRSGSRDAAARPANRRAGHSSRGYQSAKSSSCHSLPRWSLTHIAVVPPGLLARAIYTVREGTCSPERGWSDNGRLDSCIDS